MDMSWLIGDFPPGMAMLSAIQVALLYAIWGRLREIARVDHDNLSKIMDRFEKSDMAHVRDHGHIEKAMEYLRARINGGTK